MKAQEFLDKLNVQLKTDVAALEEENTELKGTVEVLEHKIAGLQAKCDVLESALRLCQESEAALAKQLTALQNQVAFGGKAGA